MHIPIIGNETEYGIYVNNVPPRISDQYSSYDIAPHVAVILVNAIVHLDVKFIDRGLERVEDIDAHTLAEERARRLHILRMQEGNRVTLLHGSSAELRQRLGYSGYMLETGARWYTDMGHPEYSTAETVNPRTIVLLQKAGDYLAERCRRRAQEDLRLAIPAPNLMIHLHRNNTDGKGHSYAGHENYCLTPDLYNAILVYELKSSPLSPNKFTQETFSHSYQDIVIRGRPVYALGPLANAVSKFFVTRSIIIGAGKVGYEYYNDSPPYQITQRGDCIKIPIGIDTVLDRGIINTRDQPLADFHQFRRLHVICGDTNVSELSLYLKAGITSLFFMMLEDGLIQRASGNLMTSLCDPVKSFHDVSRDLTLRKPLFLEDGSSITALDTQMQYCALAQSFVAEKGLGWVWQDVVHKWNLVLSGLDTDRFVCPWTSSLDWVCKENLFKSIQKRKAVSQSYLQHVELNYQSITPEKSIYEQLLKCGMIMRIVDPKEIDAMIHNTASDTRAYLRGELIKKYSHYLADIGWDYVKFKDGRLLFMDNPYKGNADHIAPLMKDNPSLDLLCERISADFLLEQYTDDE